MCVSGAPVWRVTDHPKSDGAASADQGKHQMGLGPPAGPCAPCPDMEPTPVLGPAGLQQQWAARERSSRLFRADNLDQRDESTDGREAIGALVLLPAGWIVEKKG